MTGWFVRDDLGNFAVLHGASILRETPGSGLIGAVDHRTARLIVATAPGWHTVELETTAYGAPVLP